MTPTDPLKLLPEFQKVANAFVDVAVRQAEAKGLAISCKNGCGACCRQLGANFRERGAGIRELIERLPPAQKAKVLARFAAARQLLGKAGLLERLLHPDAVVDAAVVPLGLQYFEVGIACPFSEEESCSIHADRPIACREYLVTSPAQNCAQPGIASVVGVELPAKVSQAVRRIEADDASPQWVPLILAPEWADAHRAGPPKHAGVKLVEMRFADLTKLSSALLAPIHSGRATNRAEFHLPYPLAHRPSRGGAFSDLPLKRCGELRLTAVADAKSCPRPVGNERKRKGQILVPRQLLRSMRMKTIKTLVLAASALSGCFLATAPAAVDMFLKIENIKGESTDKEHAGEIEIESFSWGVSNSAGATGGGQGAGKVNVQDISITKFFDAASPDLFIKCATGGPIKTATLTVRQSPEPQAAPQRPPGTFLEITMTDVVISSINENGQNTDSQGYLAENITLKFAKITITYSQQNADGTVSKKTVSYNLKAAKKA